VTTDDIVTRLREELLTIERHGTESLNDLDHAHLLVAAADEIERLRAEVNTWMGAAERFAESDPKFDAFAYYFKARREEAVRDEH
jgi:hypothetical protein